MKGAGEAQTVSMGWQCSFGRLRLPVQGAINRRSLRPPQPLTVPGRLLHLLPERRGCARSGACAKWRDERQRGLESKSPRAGLRAGGRKAHAGPSGFAASPHPFR